ncbi:hypothetical protein ACQ4PT_041142 [Festuca glaucescens]
MGYAGNAIFCKLWRRYGFWVKPTEPICYSNRPPWRGGFRLLPHPPIPLAGGWARLAVTADPLFKWWCLLQNLLHLLPSPHRRRWGIEAGEILLECGVGGAVEGAGGRNPNTGCGGGGNQNLVWQRDEGISGGNVGAGGSTVRWDVAAADAQGSGKDKAPAVQGGMGNRAVQQHQQRAEKNPSPGDASCLNCGSKAHFSARCPTIRSRQVKDRASSLVITVLEGNPTSRDLEKEFNEYLGSRWRCTARPINPNQYTMRFPSSKEVDKAVFYAKSMEMKAFNAVINLSPWSAAIGASGMLNKAWVRSETFHLRKDVMHMQPMQVPWDIDNIAETFEGVLGDFFYIFSYEVESIVAQGPPVVRNDVMVANSSAPPSPKCARTETYSAASAACTNGFTRATNQSDGAGYGRNCAQTLAALSEHESEEESENDSELLIDNIARENRLKHDKVATELSDSANASSEHTVVEVVNPIHNTKKVVAPITPVVDKEVLSPDSAKTDRQMVLSYAAAVSGSVWSASPVVTEIENEDPVGDEGRAEYFVQSPSVAVTEEASSAALAGSAAARGPAVPPYLGQQCCCALPGSAACLASSAARARQAVPLRLGRQCHQCLASSAAGAAPL